MINVFIDIEALPDQAEGAKDAFVVKPPGNIKKAESIQKWLDENGEAAKDEQWRKTALNGGYGSICVICVAVGNGQVERFSAKNCSESEMLTTFWGWLAGEVGSLQWRFVIHNAKFDSPFMWHRSVINCTKPIYYNPHGRHPHSHYCTMEGWAGYNKYISLDELAGILGIEGKGDMDGSKVYDTWLIDPDKVIDYCADDVRILRDVYNRMEFA